MKIRIKKRLIAEHNAKYEARLKQREISERYVKLLKAPKHGQNEIT